MTKTLVRKQGEAALKNMNDLHDLAEENRQIKGNHDAHATYIFQARSIREWAESVTKANLDLPEWYINQIAYFRSIGA